MQFIYLPILGRKIEIIQMEIMQYIIYSAGNANRLKSHTSDNIISIQYTFGKMCTTKYIEILVQIFLKIQFNELSLIKAPK